MGRCRTDLPHRYLGRYRLPAGEFVKGTPVGEGLVEANTANVAQSVRGLPYLRIHNIDEFLHGLKIIATADKVAHNVRSATFCVAVLVREFIEVFLVRCMR